MKQTKTDSDRKAAQALSSYNDSAHEADKTESASGFETAALLFDEFSDAEEKQTSTCRSTVCKARGSKSDQDCP